MRVFVSPTGLHSRAMVRVANALIRYAPSDIQIVDRPEIADLIVMHVIGYDAIEATEKIYTNGQRYIPIQYCLRSTSYTREEDWLDLWKCADFVMSYYDLSLWLDKIGTPFYHSPLGIDDAFRQEPFVQTFRENLIITSGYVDGEHAEAISEVWRAAEIAGVEAIHVGPERIEGMAKYSKTWNTRHNLTDDELASLYKRAAWVSGLRHREGHEIVCMEGLACGARPIMFYQPSIAHWYGGFPEYVEDRHGEDLVNDLVKVMSKDYRQVGLVERERAMGRFDWSRICQGFWQMVEQSMESAA